MFPPAAAPASHVLVVDDEPAIGRALRRLLERALPGVRVLEAHSGREGLDVLGRQPVDLILSDYRMPEMDGLQFFARARDVAPSVPRVLVTAFPDHDVAVQAVNEAHVEKFLVKPWDSEKLVGITRDLLAKRAGQGQEHLDYARTLDDLRRQAARTP